MINRLGSRATAGSASTSRCHGTQRRCARRLARPLRHDLPAVQPGRPARRLTNVLIGRPEPLLDMRSVLSSGRRRTSRSRCPRSNSSISPASPRSAPTASRAASNSAWRSPGRWCRSRRSFSPTSRSLRSIRATPGSSWTRCCASTGISASPCMCNLHSLELARGYCDRLVGMANGRVVFDGVPERTDRRRGSRALWHGSQGAVGDERLDAPAGALAPAAA